MQRSFGAEVGPEIVVGGKVEELPHTFIFDFFSDVVTEFFIIEGSKIIEGFYGKTGLVIGLA